MGKRDHDITLPAEYEDPHPPLPATTLERAQYIADLMECGRWQRRKTVRELSEAWGKARETIEGYACEASRLLMIPAAERDQRRAELAATVKAIFDDARRRPNLATGLPDYGSSLKAAELYARYSGLDVVTQIRVTVEQELDRVLARLERRLPLEVYEQVLEAVRAGDDVDSGALGGSEVDAVARLALPAAGRDVDGSD